jgi:hypothetical protein
MPAPTAPAGASGAQAQAAAPPSAPFRAGTIRTLNTDGYQNATALGTTATTLPVYQPTPNAYLRGVWIYSTAVTATNAATVAFAGDGPFNVYQTVVFQDANEKPIVGPFDGYTLMIVAKFGGYQGKGDARASAIYSATTGSGGTAGSWTFVLYVPLEIVSRDALGALQNKSASSAFTLQLTLNTTANVYTTAPTNAVTVTTVLLEDGWLQPKASDLTGTPLSQAPPQLGTTQYWTRGSYNALNGSQQVQLTQGLGYPIRGWLWMNYDAGNLTRATGDADFPTTTQLLFKGTSILNVPKTIWKDQMSRWYGLTSTTADSASGLENGVYVLPFTVDFTNAPGDELRNSYLGTQQGDSNQMVATFNGSSNLFFVANYVAPAAGATNLASIRAGR